MSNLCILCASQYSSKHDSIIECGFRKTLVHHECCKNKCSLDGQGPSNCTHAKAQYKRM